MSAYSDSLRLMKEEQKFTREKWNYEKSLSNSAHQREVADLQAAGLNPVLSSGGSGASYSSTSDTSSTSSAASYLSAKIAAQSSKYVANMNYKAALAAASAQRYASDMAYSSTVYSTDNSKSGTIPGVISSVLNKNGITDAIGNFVGKMPGNLKKDPLYYSGFAYGPKMFNAAKSTLRRNIRKK